MLLSDLAIGTKVADANSKYNNKIIIWTVASKNHYGSNQVTLISDVLALKPSDAKETENGNSRNSYGNNRYSLSNIHSWLNSNKDNWYEAKHSLDAPPSSSLVSANPYDTEKGFCTNLSSKFLSKVKTTTITTAIPTCDGGGSETISCKFFLPSLMEVGLGQENGISEGSQFPLFIDNASRVIEFGGASREWGLRTPASNNGYDFRHIRPNGTNYTNIANNGHIGIRTVCNIDANIEVENKSSYYELKLSNYLNENASLSNALNVLENKKNTLNNLKENLRTILVDKNIDCSISDTMTDLINKVDNVDFMPTFTAGDDNVIFSTKPSYYEPLIVDLECCFYGSIRIKGISLNFASMIFTHYREDNILKQETITSSGTWHSFTYDFSNILPFDRITVGSSTTALSTSSVGGFKVSYNK